MRELVLRQKSEYLALLLKLNEELKACYLFLASASNDESDARSIIGVSNSTPLDEFHYSITRSPCITVLESGVCAFPCDVQALYEKSDVLKQLDAKAYLGAPIRNHESKSIGLIVAVFKQNRKIPAVMKVLFDCFADQLSKSIQNAFSSQTILEQHSLLTTLCANSGIALWRYEANSERLFWSKELSILLRIKTQEHSIPITSASLFVKKAQRRRLEAEFKKAISLGGIYGGVFEITDSFNDSKLLDITMLGFPCAITDSNNVLGFVRDVSLDDKRFFEERTKREFINKILNTLTDAVLIATTDGTITYVNEATCKIFLYDESELLGANISVLMPEKHATIHNGFLTLYLGSGENRLNGAIRQVTGLRKGGKPFQLEIALSDTYINGHRMFVSSIRDISERIIAQDRIYNLAYRDSMTGLLNNHWFKKEVSCRINYSTASQFKHFFALIDIDELSRINLLYGIDLGDQIIKKIADQLSVSLGSEIGIFTKGAGAFYLIGKEISSDNSDLDHYVYLVSEFCKTRKIEVDSAQVKYVRVSLSAGYLIADMKHSELNQLINSLEYSLKIAKKESPSGIYCASESDLKAYEKLENLKHAVRCSVKRRELSVVIQPQYNLEREIVGSEVLIRWHPTQFEDVSTFDFIKLAEETGAIVDIGYWVIEKSCAILSELDRCTGVSPPVLSINISGKQFVQQDFAQRVIEIIKQRQVNPSLLTFELTETTLVSDIALVKETMANLSHIGCGFSIDDFGTGYSSLSYIKTLPINELKIDRYFVDDIAIPNASSKRLVEAVINIAKAFDLKVIAEGVETKEQLSILRDYNCNVYQGYLLSRPLSVKDWIKLVCKKSPIRT
jgi:PAS domain S-box-containing protein/diguanylate cyclase (GGDEF)-like protein